MSKDCVRRIIAGRSLTFRLDVPGVQRRSRLGSIKVFADDQAYLIRVYGIIVGLLKADAFHAFERELRAAFDKALLEELIGKPVEKFNYKRFNQSQALNSRLVTNFNVGVPA